MHTENLHVFILISLTKMTLTNSLFFVFLETSLEEPRLLGLAMIPGRHVKSLYADIDSEFHSALKDILKPSAKD